MAYISRDKQEMMVHTWAKLKRPLHNMSLTWWYSSPPCDLRRTFSTTLAPLEQRGSTSTRPSKRLSKKWISWKCGNLAHIICKLTINMSVYFSPNSSKFLYTMMANVIDNSTRHFSVVDVTHLLLQIITYTKAKFNEKHVNFKDGYK
jgi:hypothetical protein